MKFFVALSHQEREKFRPAVESIQNAIFVSGHQCLPIFVYRNDQPKDPIELMGLAMLEIDGSDGLIVEMSSKQVGVGIEMGYVHKSKKPILGVRLRGSEYSTTMQGLLSRPVIEYDNPGDIVRLLGEAIKDLPEAIKDIEQSVECQRIRQNNPFYINARKRAVQILNSTVGFEGLRDDLMSTLVVTQELLTAFACRLEKFPIETKYLNVTERLHEAEFAVSDEVRRTSIDCSSTNMNRQITLRLWGEWSENGFPDWLDPLLISIHRELGNPIVREREF